MSKSSKSEPILNIAIPNIDLNLDPHSMDDAFSMKVNLQIYRGLLRYTPSGDVTSDLAESWQVDTTNTRYTFKLRKATFSDGTPIFAEHVKHSLARMFHLGSSMGADIDYIKGVKRFRESKKIETLGIRVTAPDQLEIELERPTALLTKHLATSDCAILNIKDFTEAYVVSEQTAFSGTYRVVDIAPSHINVMKWRPGSLDSLHPPQRIHFYFTDSDIATDALNGKNDTLDRLPVSGETRKTLISRGWHESVTEVTAERFAILNPRFYTKELRAYLFSKVDQMELAKRFPKSMLPAFGVIPTGIPGALAQQDLDLLKSEAAALADPHPKGTVQIEYVASKETSDILADYLKSVWNAPGLKINLVELAPAEYMKKTFSSQGETLIAYRGLDYFDGYSVLTYFKSTYKSNYFHVHDESIDQAIDHAAGIIDLDIRASAYQNIQRQVLRHYTFIPLMFGSPASGLWSAKVKRPPAHPAGIHTLAFETIEMVE